jgi:hypothetical protein
VVRWLALAAHSLKDEIIRRQTNYAKLMGEGWKPDELSDLGWLCLVAVPWLLQEVENNRQNHGSDRDANSSPRADGIGVSEATLQLVLPKQPPASSCSVIPSRNPIAQFFKGHLAKLLHLVGWDTGHSGDVGGWAHS